MKLEVALQIVIRETVKQDSWQHFEFVILSKAKNLLLAGGSSTGASSMTASDPCFRERLTTNCQRMLLLTTGD